MDLDPTFVPPDHAITVFPGLDKEGGDPAAGRRLGVGASKWNPIEHRFFSELSENWAGRPPDSYGTILHYARTTTTNTGLRVRVHLVNRPYKKGIKIPDAQMRELAIQTSEDLPKWNYSIFPS